MTNDDENHEAYGAMMHAMKHRDHHREIAGERDKLRSHVSKLTISNERLCAEVERLARVLRTFCVDAEHGVIEQETLDEARAVLKEMQRDS